MTAQYECYQKIMQDSIQQTEGKQDFNFKCIWYNKKTTPLHHYGFLRSIIKNGLVAIFSGYMDSFIFIYKEYFITWFIIYLSFTEF